MLMPFRLISFIAATTLVTSPAMARQPFEGSWCDDGGQLYSVDSKIVWIMEKGADGDGDCRITKVAKSDAKTWQLNLRCADGPTRYTIRMTGPDKAVFKGSSPGYEAVEAERCDD